MSVCLERLALDRIIQAIDRREGQGAPPRRIEIVGCIGCAALSCAQRRPDVALMNARMRPSALELEISEMRDHLLDAYPGVSISWHCQRTLCCWSKRFAQRLRRQCRDADVVLVMGCPSGAKSIRMSLRDPRVDQTTPVICAMKITGLEPVEIRRKGLRWYAVAPHRQ